MFTVQACRLPKGGGYHQSFVGHVCVRLNGKPGNLRMVPIVKCIPALTGPYIDASKIDPPMPNQMFNDAGPSKNDFKNQEKSCVCPVALVPYKSTIRLAYVNANKIGNLANENKMTKYIRDHSP